MGSEDEVREAVAEILRGRWVFDRVENKRVMPAGFADTVYTLETGARGFIEFKYLPRLDKAKVKIGLTRDQVLFAERHGSMGGRCCLILGVGLGSRFYCFQWWSLRGLLQPVDPSDLLKEGELLVTVDDFMAALSRRD